VIRIAVAIVLLIMLGVAILLALAEWLERRELAARRRRGGP
jgi:NADH:ubiquinone oxidoreductase subunit H